MVYGCGWRTAEKIRRIELRRRRTLATGCVIVPGIRVGGDAEPEDVEPIALTLDRSPECRSGSRTALRSEPIWLGAPIGPCRKQRPVLRPQPTARCVFAPPLVLGHEQRRPHR